MHSRLFRSASRGLLKEDWVICLPCVCLGYAGSVSPFVASACATIIAETRRVCVCVCVCVCLGYAGSVSPFAASACAAIIAEALPGLQLMSADFRHASLCRSSQLRRRRHGWHPALALVLSSSGSNVASRRSGVDCIALHTCFFLPSRLFLLGFLSAAC